MNNEPGNLTPGQTKFGVYMQGLAQAAPLAAPRFWDNLETKVPIAGVTVDVLCRRRADEPEFHEYLVQCPKLPGVVTLQTPYTPQSLEIGNWLVANGVIETFQEDGQTVRYVANASSDTGTSYLEFPSLKLLAHGIEEYEKLMSPKAMETQVVALGVISPLNMDIVAPEMKSKLAANAATPEPPASGLKVTPDLFQKWSGDTLVPGVQTHGRPSPG